MTEFADLGAHCYYDLCKQQSFLPFDCGYCKKTFCEHHRIPKDHQCKHIPKQQNNFKTFKKKKKFRCKVKGCKAKTLMLLKCAKCNGGFCTNHRHCDLHNCPKDVTENKGNTTDESNEEIADNRWVFVKTELCKNWNAKIVHALQVQIGEEEYDFDDVIDDFGEYSIDSNESALMDYLMDEYQWEDKMAQNFHKDITNALDNAPQLEITHANDSDGDDDIDDIYSHAEDKATVNDVNETNDKSNNITVSEEKKTMNVTQNTNIIQWIYNEVSKCIIQSQVMNVTNKVIETLMSDETDDQMQYQLWQVLGGHSSPTALIQHLRNNRASICDQINKL